MKALILVAMVASGCGARALDIPEETQSAAMPTNVQIMDATGIAHTAVCSNPAGPTAEQSAKAIELAWKRVLDMADAPEPVTNWEPGTLGGADVDGDGKITIAWGGSYGCTPQWVDELLLYRRYLMTGNMGYAFPSGQIDQKAYTTDQAEGDNARAALADAGL